MKYTLSTISGGSGLAEPTTYYLKREESQPVKQSWPLQMGYFGKSPLSGEWLFTLEVLALTLDDVAVIRAVLLKLKEEGKIEGEWIWTR